MCKSMGLLVLVALAACVFAIESPDQETAEQYFRIHGVYPSWYPNGVTAFNGVRAFSLNGYPGFFPHARLYPAAVYPAASVAGVKNGVYPYPFVPFGYGYNNPYIFDYGAVPYVTAAPAKA